jgi:hypothetical protein
VKDIGFGRRHGIRYDWISVSEDADTPGRARVDGDDGADFLSRSFHSDSKNWIVKPPPVVERPRIPAPYGLVDLHSKELATR